MIGFHPSQTDQCLSLRQPLIVIAMMLGFAVVPFAPDLVIIDMNIGLLFFLGMTSLAVYSVLLGGLASKK